MEKRINDETELIRLGFVRHPDWDCKDPKVESYRLETKNNVYRAHVDRFNGKPFYAKLGIIIDHDRGIVDRWRDCVSSGSVERKIMFNEGQI